ncbi:MULTISPECIES: ribosomal L7Ae/L30e/S12e/Gadd45 family protein [Megasphaera]|uniref:Ribosomal protein L7Ae n=1 Tax=Megasphaera vaginalis (ex Srinivasan et al. 2021) TaxID=1111454 RepID=U7UK82_9FIRM|nr:MULTISPECIES: ribosomal L7Ae/L30e/S12e/Gadd45 family protein [Megasphaera]ERT59691.1 ribosomal protein L7Ae [Megasphaera vaginalis (ex Srinivasan et al. 2021)]
MSLDLKAAAKTIGAKQTFKAMKRNEVTQLYLASDSDPNVISPLESYAAEVGIAVDKSYTMEELGAACRIKVKAAAVGLLK